jgi:hypothetical protein
MFEDTPDDQPSQPSNEISDETGSLDVRFALWKKFCAENGVPVESLPSGLSGEEKIEWEKLKERDLLKPNS